MYVRLRGRGFGEVGLYVGADQCGQGIGCSAMTP